MFLTGLFSLVNFSYWSRFHFNIITGSGVMTIFFCKGLTRNPDIRNTPSGFCPISGDWDKLGITKFDANVSNKISLNTAKCQGYGFFRF